MLQNNYNHYVCIKSVLPLWVMSLCFSVDSWSLFPNRTRLKDTVAIITFTTYCMTQMFCIVFVYSLCIICSGYMIWNHGTSNFNAIDIRIIRREAPSLAKLSSSPIFISYILYSIIGIVVVRLRNHFECNWNLKYSRCWKTL